MGQAITAAMLPALTRLYTPEAFSVLAAYTAAVALIVAIVPMRWEIAIPIPEEDGEATHLMSLAALTTALGCLTLAAAFALFPSITTGLFGATYGTQFAWLLPLGAFGAATYNIAQYWTTRRRRFGTVALTHATRAAVGSVTQLGLGTLNASPLGLVIGHAVYGAVGVASLVRSMWRHDRASLGRVRPSIETARRFWRFPAFSLPEALFNKAGSEVPILIIAALGQPGEAGLLLVASRVMGVPMALIGRSVSQVFLSEAGDHARSGRLGTVARDATRRLLFVGIPVLTLSGALATMVFPPLLGDTWAGAGVVLLMLAPWYALQFATSPVSSVLHASGRLRLAALLQLAGAVLRVGGVSAAVWLPFGSLTGAYALSSATFYAFYFVAVRAVAARLEGDPSEVTDP